MPSLKSQHCDACHPGAQMLSEAELLELMTQLSNWTLTEQDGVRQLQRDVEFNNFASAWEFTNKVAGLAELEDHHPVILLEWGKVTVTWWTHAIGGLHMNDAVMAAKTDELLAH